MYKRQVRYIAINDHFDSINPNSTDSDIAGIKNWFNEFFAKDTSRKIRAVQKAKGERGERLTVHVPVSYTHLVSSSEKQAFSTVLLRIR